MVLTLNDDSFRYIEDLSKSQDTVMVHMKRETQQSFNFFPQPLKLCLIRSDTQDYLVLRLHHAAYDAWTIQTIVIDLAAIYRNAVLPTPPRLVSFIDRSMRHLHKQPEEIY